MVGWYKIMVVSRHTLAGVTIAIRLLYKEAADGNVTVLSKTIYLLLKVWDFQAGLFVVLRTRPIECACGYS